MTVLFKLLIIFVTIPLLELALLFKVAEWIGGWETFGLVIITGIVGSILTRQEGLRTLRSVQNELHANRLPALEFVSGFLVFAAGLLLLTPGIMTDIVGFAVLIPPLRIRLAQYILTRLKLNLKVSTESDRTSWQTPGGRRQPNYQYPDDDNQENEVIEVEAEVIDEDEN